MRLQKAEGTENSWGSLSSFGSLKSILSFEMIIKFHQAHKTHRSILKTSWKNPANILRTSREHLENIKRTSIDYLEKIQKHLWSSKNICEHLSTSEHILITYENLYRISVINWGSFEKCLHRGWLSIKFTTQLKTSENSREHQKTSKIIWYHPENNWGPIIDNLDQLEEDFNSRKTSSENNRKTVGKHRKTAENIGKHLKSSDIILRTTEDPS